MTTATRVKGPRSFSDDAVKSATGKTWAQWYAILDAWGVKQHGHTATAKFLRQKHKVPPWWSQAVTARYEWDHGLKKPQPAK